MITARQCGLAVTTIAIQRPPRELRRACTAVIRELSLVARVVTHPSEAPGLFIRLPGQALLGQFELSLRIPDQYHLILTSPSHHYPSALFELRYRAERPVIEAFSAWFYGKRGPRLGQNGQPPGHADARLVDEAIANLQAALTTDWSAIAATPLPS